MKTILTGVSWQKLSRTGAKSETNGSLLTFALDDDRVPILQELALFAGARNEFESCLFDRLTRGRAIVSQMQLTIQDNHFNVSILGQHVLG